MATEINDKCALKKLTVESLLGSFSFNHEERIKAEDQIKILETMDDFGLILTEITIEVSFPVDLRQLASVLLKQYIDCHWSSLSEEKFRPPEVSPDVKSLIRQNLPNGLQDENSKIRSSVAYAMSKIASYDWPNDWPDLFMLLMQALHSMNQNVIHGAMRVFSEFAGEVSDLQVPHIAPVILPEMLKIFSHPEIYGIRTSSRAASIFSTIMGLIGLMKEVNKGVDKHLLMPYLPQFLEVCSHQLTVPESETSDCGLKMEVLKALEVVVKNFPRTISHFISSILPPVWQTFTQSVDIYIKTTVNCVDLSEDPVDEDGEILSFENLVFSIFEFISALVEKPKFKETVEQYLEDILFYTMVYMQITDEQINLWSNDPNQFVEDEDEETFSYSVRISAQYLLLSLSENFKSAIKKLCNAVARLKRKSDELRAQNNMGWWKYNEVCLISLGYVQPSVEEKLESGEIPPDFRNFLFEMLSSSLSSQGTPFLLGQSFWCASRYVAILDDNGLHQTIQATVRALQDDQCPVLRVFAVKSLFGFCEFLQKNERHGVIIDKLESIMSGLISLATHYSDSVLAITLETLVIVIKVNEDFTSRIVESGNLLPLINALFIKYGTDHHLSPIIEEFINELVSIPLCSQHVLEKTVPTLLSILEASNEKIPSAIIPPTLDIITKIVRNGPKPLNEVFFKRSFPHVIKKIMDSDDAAILQSGGETLRAYIACATHDVVLWQDCSGQNGLSYIVTATCKLLDPRCNESSAMLVGKLVNTLVLKAGSMLGDNLSIILRSVLSKLQQCQYFTITQSLLMVFIQLLRNQLEATLEFLSMVPGPSGNSALDYILSEWCAKHSSFIGGYEIISSIDAICKLLMYIVATNDVRFETIHVNGDEIINGEGRVLRSHSKKEAEFSKIPVAIKLFKLVVAELVQLELSENAEGEEEEDSEEEDDWEDIGDNSNEITVQQAIEAILSQGNKFEDYEEEDFEDDPDTKEDPLNNTDLKTILTHFLEEFCQLPYFSNFTQTLNDTEKLCLKKLGYFT
ncbi:importin-9 isoform X1 [Hydra vulgaris]|uniref:importin-9 isoform X1 n=1 Tax=Hydra vulgaris TaxID=6087 RepID=UPI001F5F51E3|nr:importin-9 [Hydra vulgaris]